MKGGAANERLVELADLDELVRQIDRLCDDDDWDGLVDLRDRCRAALERGKQLWPAASLAEYRLALDAPGSFAGQVLVPGHGAHGAGAAARGGGGAAHVEPAPRRTSAGRAR